MKILDRGFKYTIDDNIVVKIITPKSREHKNEIKREKVDEGER